MAERHEFGSRIDWTRNRGSGTSAYKAYDRTWSITTPGKAVVRCSNDPRLGGDTALPFPRTCCPPPSPRVRCSGTWRARGGIVVADHRNDPVVTGESMLDGARRIVRAILRPNIARRAGAG